MLAGLFSSGERSKERRKRRSPEEEDNLAEHAMSLTLQPKVPLELSVAEEYYLVTGPTRQWNMLEAACGIGEGKTLHVRGRVSPKHAITVPLETHEAAAIPNQAASFAFAYPAMYAISTPESKRLEVVVRRSPRSLPALSASPPIGQNDEPATVDCFPASFYESFGFRCVGPLMWQLDSPDQEALEAQEAQEAHAAQSGSASVSKSRRGSLPPVLPFRSLPGNVGPLLPMSPTLNFRGNSESPKVTDAPVDLSALAFKSLEKRLESLNLADEKWAFLLLVGGFLFFDESDKLIQANALTLVASDFQMHFDGPFAPSGDALHGMRQAGRVVPVTLGVLQDAGFAAYGWVHADEAFDGHWLDEDGAASMIEHGALVYEIFGGDPIFFQLVPHRPSDLMTFAEAMEVKRRSMPVEQNLQNQLEGGLRNVTNVKDATLGVTTGVLGALGDGGALLMGGAIGAVSAIRDVTFNDVVQGKILTNTMNGVVHLTEDSVRMAAGGAMELAKNSAKIATSSAEMAKNSGKLAKEQAMRAAAEVKAHRTAEKKLNAAMHKLTQETDQEGQRLARRSGLLTRRIFYVWLGGPVVVLILIPMAYVSNLAFEALANLVWTACFVLISVRPVSSPKPPLCVRASSPPPPPPLAPAINQPPVWFAS